MKYMILNIWTTHWRAMWRQQRDFAWSKKTLLFDLNTKREMNRVMIYTILVSGKWKMHIIKQSKKLLWDLKNNDILK